MTADQRKIDTFLRLYREDRDFAFKIAKADDESLNASFRRLINTLRRAGVESYLDLDQRLQNNQNNPKVTKSVNI